MTDGPSQLNKKAAVLATGDQVVHSLGSFALTSGVARVAPVNTFAQFAIIYLSFQILLSLSRSGHTEPYMVQRATAGSDGLLADRRLVGAVTFSSLVVTTVGLAVALVLDDPARALLQALAIGFPLVAVLDCSRYVAIARSRPGVALALDSVRVGGFLAVVAAWTVLGEPSAMDTVLAWLACSVVGLVGLFLALHLRPQRPAIAAWWRVNGRMALGYGSENLMNRAAAYSVAYSLVWFASLPDVAGFRAGSSLTNLITIFFASIPMVLMPHYRRSLTSATAPVSRRRLLQIAGTVSGVVVGMTAAGSLVLLNLPDQIGTSLFGDTWEEATKSLPGLLFWTAGSAATLGPLMVLRATARVRHSVVARLVQSITVVVFGTAGAALGGAPGAAYGLGVGAWIGVGGWYRTIWRDGSWAPPRLRLADDADPVPASDPA